MYIGILSPLVSPVPVLSDSQRIADMGQGKKMSPEVQQAIVQMSGRLSDEEISMYLDILTCSVRCVMLHFRKYGTIPDTQEPAQEGCQNNWQQLQGVDVEVSC